MIEFNINNTDDLIYFIENTDLAIKQYEKVLREFKGSFIAIFENATKKDIIGFIERFRKELMNESESPLFIP